MKRSIFTGSMQRGMVAITIALASSVFTIDVCAQANQLSLADIIIALRSKKVTLTERNKILTEAIATRGTTFTLTPEIEKELTETGAAKALLDSIRQRPQVAKTASSRPLPIEPKPKAEPPKSEPVAPPVQDAAFYETRAKENVAKGDLDAALVDFTKAVEMNGSAVSVLLGRGRTYVAKKSYVLAIADFTKAIELDPKNVNAFSERGAANEAQGNGGAALDDYRKALELDPTIEAAKSAVGRINAERAKLAEKTKPEPEPPAVPPVPPEYVDLGSIGETQATKMVKPIYSQGALRSGLGGQVVVEIEIDTKGNVTKAKAVSGNQFLRRPSEDAASRSTFKPAMIGGVPIKAKARIVYDFVAGR